MFKDFKNEWLYYLLTVVVIYIMFSSISNMLTSPLTSEQLNDIRTKITAYNLEFVRVTDKQMFGCGNGHLYRVPVVAKNKEGQEVIINYCSGNFLTTTSQIKI